MFNFKSWFVRKSVRSNLVRFSGSPDCCSDNKIQDFEACSSVKYQNKVLAEEHHLGRGRPWALGRDYFDFLISNKLINRSDRVLELGCGEGRLGIWLIGYLNKGRYFGQDIECRPLLVFKEYEMFLHGLNYKAPTLICGELSEAGDASGYMNKFNVVLDLYATQRIKQAEILNAYRSLVCLLDVSGSIISASKPALSEADIYSLGLDIQFIGEAECELLGKFKYSKSKNRWYKLVKNRC